MSDELAKLEPETLDVECHAPVEQDLAINKEIHDFLKSPECSGQVKNKVKDVLIEKEIVSRTELVMKGLDKRKQMLGDLRKIKPDLERIVDDGTEKGKKVCEWTPAKFKEKKDATEKLKKLSETRLCLMLLIMSH
jgi:hypothetical protein